MTPGAEFNTYADSVASARIFALTSRNPQATMPPTLSGKGQLPSYPEKLSRQLTLKLFPLGELNLASLWFGLTRSRHYGTASPPAVALHTSRIAQACRGVAAGRVVVAVPTDDIPQAAQPEPEPGRVQAGAAAARPADGVVRAVGRQPGMGVQDRRRAGRDERTVDAGMLHCGPQRTAGGGA
jgi:hypothetical protein